jgi:hypothetical protein
MDTNAFQHSRLFRITGLIMIPALLNACAAYRLSDKNPQYTLGKVHEATQGTCAVAPFRYEPTDKSDADLMTPKDLEIWNQQFFQAVNRADLCGRTIKVNAGQELPSSVDYLIDGKVTNFYFKKNWVPMFFPGWVGLTFFTLGVYAIAAGPTTSTKVDFGFTVNLKDPKTGTLLDSSAEKFQSTDVMTIYSDSNTNPYGNPGLAFAPTINNAMRKLSDAISRAEAQKPDDTRSTLRKLGDLKKQGVLTEEEYLEKVRRLTE